MNNFQALQEKLKDCDKNSLKKALGYNNEETFTKSIGHIIEAKDLAELLYAGHFDFLYGSKQLVCKIAEIFGLDLSGELEEAEKYNAEVFKHCDSEMYLRAETNFKRTTESVLTLGMASRAKVVDIPNRRDFYFKPFEEKIKLIGNLIRDAYAKTPEVPIFGAITAYRWHFNKNNYLFNVSGEKVGQVA